MLDNDESSKTIWAHLCCTQLHLADVVRGQGLLWRPLDGTDAVVETTLVQMAAAEVAAEVAPEESARQEQHRCRRRPTMNGNPM